MKIKEIRDLGPEELKQRETHLREELFNLQMQHGASQLDNPKRMGQVKREIARVLTVIGEQKAKGGVPSPSEV